MSILKVSLMIAVLILFALALYSAYGAYRTELAYPPLGNFVEEGGIRLHYVEKGEGSPIVLIHGASTSLIDFHASIFEPLARHHRAIAVDRPGYGYSQRPSGEWPDPLQQARLIRGALSRLDIEKPILVGHSWSGSVVLAYLLAFPEDVAGGVLLAGGSHPWKGGVAWYNHVASMPLIGPLFAYTVAYPAGQLLMNAAVNSVFTPNPVPPRYIERTGILLSLRPHSFMASAEDVRNLSEFLRFQSARYNSIRRPLLLITGDADEVVPPWNHADRLIKQVPHAELIKLADTGHALHHAHPERITKLIRDFRRRVIEKTN
jgi:pimeloyl-ACP methyl ester carboxylesterase